MPHPTHSSCPQHPVLCCSSKNKIRNFADFQTKGGVLVLKRESERRRQEGKQNCFQVPGGFSKRGKCYLYTQSLLTFQSFAKIQKVPLIFLPLVFFPPKLVLAVLTGKKRGLDVRTSSGPWIKLGPNCGMTLNGGLAFTFKY